MNKELTPLQALKQFRNSQYQGVNVYADELLDIIETELKNAEKNKKVLKEIMDIYGEWLGYRKNDFEFFTLLQEIVCKNELSEEVLK